jgi:hypothetical protein
MEIRVHSLDDVHYSFALLHARARKLSLTRLRRA